MLTYNLVVLQKAIRHFCDTWKINSFKKIVVPVVSLNRMYLME